MAEAFDKQDVARDEGSEESDAVFLTRAIPAETQTFHLEHFEGASLPQDVVWGPSCFSDIHNAVFSGGGAGTAEEALPLPSQSEFEHSTAKYNFTCINILIIVPFLLVCEDILRVSQSCHRHD